MDVERIGQGELAPSPSSDDPRHAHGTGRVLCSEHEALESRHRFEVAGSIQEIDVWTGPWWLWHARGPDDQDWNLVRMRHGIIHAVRLRV